MTTDSKREALIEEAAATIAVAELLWTHRTWGDLLEPQKDSYRRLASQVRNVFEQANTPTDDEIRLAALAAVKKGAKSDAEAVRNFREAERVIRAAIPHLRRPVQGEPACMGVLADAPEPSAELCYWCTQPASGAAVWQGDGDRYASCGQEGHGLLFASSEPQGEPSEAMVQRFLLEEWRHEDWGYDGSDDPPPYCACGDVLDIENDDPVGALDRHRVRAALRAAFQKGENR